MKDKDISKESEDFEDATSLAEAAQNARDKTKHTGASLSGAEHPKGRLRDDKNFIRYVASNLWENRREHGWPWKADVIEYLRAVYADWLNVGLYRSDFRTLDPKLYMMLNKHLHSLDSEDAKQTVLEDLGILPEFGDAAVDRIKDPEERGAVRALREYHRERTKRYRAKKSS